MTDKNLLRATIEAIGEELTLLSGYRLTRLRSDVAAGATSLPVESVYGFDASGRLYLLGETDPVTYTGVDLTPGAQQFTGVSGVALAHAENEEVVDGNRTMSRMDQLRRAMLVDYADGRDLNRIGRREGVPRPRQITDDDMYRSLIKVMAYMSRSRVYALEQVLEILFPGDWGIYESLIEDPGIVYLTIPGTLVDDPAGRAYLSHQDEKTSSTTTAVTLDNTPDHVESVLLAPFDQTLNMATLPTAASPAWTFQAESTGTEGGYFTSTSAGSQQLPPAHSTTTAYYLLHNQGTLNGGRYKHSPNALNNLSRRWYAECYFYVQTMVSHVGQPWHLCVRDGSKEYDLIWDDADAYLGQSDETKVSAAASGAVTTGKWMHFSLERDGDEIIGRANGAVLRAKVSDFAASGTTELTWGYFNNGNAQNWTVRWAQVAYHVENWQNYWNLYRTVGSLNSANQNLVDSGSLFVAGDDGKLVRLYSTTENKNTGLWEASYSSATTLVLDGIERDQGYASASNPDRFYSVDPFFSATDVGKQITVITGPNAGDVTILEFISENEIRHSGVFVTDIDISWKFKPVFATESNVPYELVDASSNTGAALTLRNTLPAANTDVVVTYSTFESAELMRNETVDGNTASPFYLFGGPPWLTDWLSEDVTAAGIIPQFIRSY